jgi:hypothetical protein
MLITNGRDGNAPVEAIAIFPAPRWSINGHAKQVINFG